MNIHRFFAGATVAAVLTIASPAYAGLLGGNAAGAVNGTLGGRMGDANGTLAGRATGSIDAQTDAVGRVGRHTRDIGERTTKRAKETAGTVRDRTESTVDQARDTTVPQGLLSGNAAAGGSLDKSVSVSKSVEAGDRTVEAMHESSAQGAANGSAGAERDSGSLDLSGNGSAQSATGVTTGRKPKATEPATEQPPAQDADYNDSRDRR